MPAAMHSVSAGMLSVPANVDCLQEEEYIGCGTWLGVVISVVIVILDGGTRRRKSSRDHIEHRRH